MHHCADQAVARDVVHNPCASKARGDLISRHSFGDKLKRLVHPPLLPQPPHYRVKRPPPRGHPPHPPSQHTHSPIHVARSHQGLDKHVAADRIEHDPAASSLTDKAPHLGCAARPRAASTLQEGGIAPHANRHAPRIRSTHHSEGGGVRVDAGSWATVAPTATNGGSGHHCHQPLIGDRAHAAQDGCGRRHPPRRRQCRHCRHIRRPPRSGGGGGSFQLCQQGQARPRRGDGVSKRGHNSVVEDSRRGGRHRSKQGHRVGPPAGSHRGRSGGQWVAIFPSSDNRLGEGGGLGDAGRQ